MKFKITFSLSQNLCGFVKNVIVVAKSVDKCWELINQAYSGVTWIIKVVSVEEVDDGFPTGIWKAGHGATYLAEVIRSYFNHQVSSNIEPHSR